MQGQVGADLAAGAGDEYFHSRQILQAGAPSRYMRRNLRCAQVVEAEEYTASCRSAKDRSRALRPRQP